MNNQINKIKSSNFIVLLITVFVMLNLTIFVSCNYQTKQVYATKSQENEKKQANVSIVKSSNLCEAIVYETPVENKDCYYLEEKLINSARNGNLTEIKEALQSGANIEGTYYESFPALYTASMFGQTKAVELLLGNGANVNRVLTFGKTPLKGAVYSNHLDTVKALIEGGADVCNNISEEGTALQIAQKKNYQEIIEVLKSSGAGGC